MGHRRILASGSDSYTPWFTFEISEMQLELYELINKSNGFLFCEKNESESYFRSLLPWVVQIQNLWKALIHQYSNRLNVKVKQEAHHVTSSDLRDLCLKADAMNHLRFRMNNNGFIIYSVNMQL
ncbi:MAG: hypothetical protein MHMPM18_002669 [Marteilia pararefringens]